MQGPVKRFIDAYKGLFAATANSGGDLARTSEFTLQNVDWKATPMTPDPSSHHIVDTFLESTCTSSGLRESTSGELAMSLLQITDQLRWRASGKASVDGPDIEILLQNFAITMIIGEGGLLQSDKVMSGFSLQGRDTYYPSHSHLAEESYWIIGGSGDWRVGSNPWFAVQAGDSVYHEPHARHAMQTNDQAMLTVWLWTSDLDSEVLIVRA